MSNAADWFDLFDSQLREDPYPVFHRLRAEAPVHAIADGVWVLSRYEDAWLTLRDRRFGRDFGDAIELAYGSGESAQLQRLAVLNREPPGHTSLRTLLARALPVQPGRELRQRVQGLVDRLLDAALPRGEMDVIAELAQPLPILVVSELLGVDAGDWRRLKGWTEAIAPLFDVLVPAPVVQRADAAIGAFYDYLRPLLADRRRRPRQDVLTVLASAAELGLSEEELLANAVLLYFAGHETTANLIGNGLLALLRNPGQLDRLTARDDLFPSAVEEFCRYDSPGQITARVTLDDVRLGRHSLPRGAVVLVLIGAANRDPARFAAPDLLDVGRSDNAHLTFGGGHHYCLGAGLARLEAELAIRALLRRLTGLRLGAGRVVWRDTVNLHGPRALPVSFRT